ncbi:hypothetical protein [Cohnella sp.]|uniref:hypothetical protein n=1 Tax=Cohnella sp. TaxID=1883426 RepID=UPI003569DB75
MPSKGILHEKNPAWPYGWRGIYQKRFNQNKKERDKNATEALYKISGQDLVFMKLKVL